MFLSVSLFDIIHVSTSLPIISTIMLDSITTPIFPSPTNNLKLILDLLPILPLNYSAYHPTLDPIPTSIHLLFFEQS